MLLKFRNNTFLEKPPGSKLVGLKREGVRPVSIELDYYDFKKILAPDVDSIKYFVHLWTALAPDKRLEFMEKYNNGTV